VPVKPKSIRDSFWPSIRPGDFGRTAHDQKKSLRRSEEELEPPPQGAAGRESVVVVDAQGNRSVKLNMITIKKHLDSRGTAMRKKRAIGLNHPRDNRDLRRPITDVDAHRRRSLHFPFLGFVRIISGRRLLRRLIDHPIVNGATLYQGGK
jgi:hypothetical protein